MSINSTLQALGALVQGALPQVTVNAPDLAIDPATSFPVVQVAWWRLQLERTEAGLWGNLMWDHPHAHGPDLWRITVLQSPLQPGLDEASAKLALGDNVDAIRQAIIANPTLTDASGTSSALDIADHIYTETDSQGIFIQWHRIAYIGAYITLEVQQLRRPAGG